MRVWYSDLVNEAQFYKEGVTDLYPNGVLLPYDCVVELNGETMSRVLYADDEKGVITFYDKITHDYRTKTGNVSIKVKEEGS